MKYNSIHSYLRNKNTFFEGVEDKFFYKLNRCLLRYLMKYNIHPVVPERIIEYPILFQYIRTDTKNILDFGCVEDLLPIHLCSLGYSVTGLDFRPYPFTHENFKFIQTDILSWNPPSEIFDTVISISTIEHVGLSAYGDPPCANGDKVAVEKLLISLKRNGDLIITLPAGKKCTKRGMRIYDMELIKNLIPNIKLIRFFYKPHRYGDWRETSSETISALIYDDYYAASPVQGVAIIIANKT